MLIVRRCITVKTPLPREIRQSLGFRASNTDLVELDNPSLTLEDPLPSQPVHTVQVPFQFNVHAQYALANTFLYILPIILV